MQADVEKAQGAADDAVDLKSENEQLKEELERMKAKYDTVADDDNKEIAADEKSIHRLRGEVSRLMQDVEEKNAALAELLGQVESLRQENQALQEQAQSLGEENQAMQDQAK